MRLFKMLSSRILCREITQCQIGKHIRGDIPILGGEWNQGNFPTIVLCHHYSYNCIISYIIA